MKNYDKLPLNAGIALLAMLLAIVIFTSGSNSYQLFRILASLFAVSVAAGIIWYNHVNEEHKNDILD